MYRTASFGVITPKPLQALIEEARLSALDRYRHLSARDVAGLSRVATAAAQNLGATQAAISFVDSSRVWLGGAFGFDRSHAPRASSYCDAVVRSNAALLVPDGLIDPRFWDHELVRSEPGLRSYAGVPLVDGGGYTLGTVAVYSVATGRFAASVLSELGALATLVRDFLSEAGSVSSTLVSEPVRRVQGWLGVKTVGVASGAGKGGDAGSPGGVLPGGVLIVSVAKGSPAADAGLRPTDILYSIGAQAVSAGSDIAAAMAGRAAGSRLAIRFRRTGRWQECEIEIRAKRRLVRAR